MADGVDQTDKRPNSATSSRVSALSAATTAAPELRKVGRRLAWDGHATGKAP